jgi:TonB family protein
MSRVPITSEWVGRVIDGRFALQDWLGGSASSGVFLTELPQPISKRAAIKLIPVEGSEGDAYLARWAKIANLSHPHLMKVFRSGRFQFGSTNLVYVVTECADEVLSQILPERALTPEETREMLELVIDAVDYLHGKSFVHGHLKPSNILVVNDQLKLSADDVIASGSLRDRFQVPGVCDPPESMRGVIVPSVDVWALGTTLVEVLTQRPPVWEVGANREAVVPASIPRPFAEIARECLRRDPDQRPTLSEIKARLEPSRPIEFPVSRTEKASAAREPVSFMAGSLEADAEASAAGGLKKRLLPLVAGVLVVFAVLAWLMMRSHARPNAVPAGTKQGASEVSASGNASAETGVTAKGAVAHRVVPEVPAYARNTIRGTVSMAIRVMADATGQVTNATFKSGGSSKYFERTALDAARGWKFKPPLKDGQPVESAWLIHFKFRQSGTETAAVEETP